MTQSFGENSRRLVATTSASLKAVVRATKLCFVILVARVCKFDHEGKIGDKLPVAISLGDAWCVSIIRLPE